MDEDKYRKIKAICLVIATLTFVIISYFLSCHLRYQVTDGCSIIDKATGKIEMVKQ